MKLSKEIKVGFVAIFAMAILVWGYNFLKGKNILFSSKIIYTQYPSVGGLVKSSPILVNGFQVGVVNDIYFNPNQSGNIIVAMTITDKTIKIPENSIANLVSLDLLSSKAIGLKLGDSKEELHSGDTVQSFFEKSMLDDVSEQILPIKQKAENLMISMDSAVTAFKATLENLNDVLNDKNKRNLSAALANLSTTMQSYNELANNLNSTINTSVKPTLKTYKNLGDSLAALDMKTTLDKAQRTLDGISAVMDKVNKGEGTLGQLMTNDSLYQNLEMVSKDMDKLMIDMRENPKRYVHFSIFGRKDKKEKD